MPSETLVAEPLSASEHLMQNLNMTGRREEHLMQNLNMTGRSAIGQLFLMVEETQSISSRVPKHFHTPKDSQAHIVLSHLHLQKILHL